MQEKSPYQDMLYLPHPTSQWYAPMPRSSRAAQFAPFAALSGYAAMVQEAARLTQPRMELDESERERLDWNLRQLAARLPEHPKVTCTYFQPDAKKPGGLYCTAAGSVRSVDQNVCTLTLADGTQIRFEDLIALEF